MCVGVSHKLQAFVLPFPTYRVVLLSFECWHGLALMVISSSL